MSIEFRCTTCGKLLRTQAGTEGKKAKCPECGTVLDIPFASQGPVSPIAPPPRDPNFGAPPPRDPIGPGAYQAAANPYQAPSAYAPTATVERGFHPTRIEFGETFSRTWEIYKANLGACILGCLVYGACSIAASIVLQVPFFVVLSQLEGPAWAAVYVVQQVIGQGVSVFFALGLLMYMLRIARGEGMDVATLFGGAPYFVTGFAVQILIILAVMVGFALLIVPGIILGLMFALALFLVVDQRAGIVDSLKLSAAAMQGNKLTVLAIWVVTAGLMLLVMVVTCFIGLIFAIPFSALLMAVIYLGATGQKTMLDGPAQTAAERGFGATGAQPAG